MAAGIHATKDRDRFDKQRRRRYNFFYKPDQMSTRLGGAFFVYQSQRIRNRKENVIEIITSPARMQEQADNLRRAGKTIAFVPTMGCLHAGHLSLIRLAKTHGDHAVLSIFVNPTQFGPGEDFAAYPRQFEKDAQAAAGEGIDTIFAPRQDDLYNNKFETYVSLDKLPHHLCGLSRPHHFRGVATVVTKLFNIVKPHAAIFGEKDYQQLAIIRRLAADLNIDVKIIGAPIIRENDGLAMSSRNIYLTPAQRPSALSLYRSLLMAAEMVRQGETRAGRITEAVAQHIRACPETDIDYITLCDPESLEEIETVAGKALMALAVRVGPKCRLIDNMLLEK